MNAYLQSSPSRQTALLAALLLAWLPALAQADVALTNSVQKVLLVTGSDGQPTTSLVPAEEVVPGDTLRYTITFANTGSEPVDAGSIVITNPIPAETRYLAGTAFGSGTAITYSVDDGERFAAPADLVVATDSGQRPADAADYTTIRWVFEPALAPGATGRVSFQVQLQ